MKKISFLLAAVIFFSAVHSQTIDRKALVQRHNVVNTKFDPLSSLTVGNGSFAFTTDITGLQSFPEAYAKGVPLGTQSEWGWHSFPNKKNYRLEESIRTYNLNGRDVTYTVQWNQPARNREASTYFRENLHRLHLANLGFEFIKINGTPAEIRDLKDVRQTLDLYNGEIHSEFTIDGKKVEVFTYCHGSKDIIGVSIISDLVEEQRVRIRLRFPYPSATWGDAGDEFKNENSFTADLTTTPNSASIKRTMDTTVYYSNLQWTGKAWMQKMQNDYFVLMPGKAKNFSFTCQFTPKAKQTSGLFEDLRKASRSSWPAFWSSGGAVDFSGSEDPRANELERRVILSQYLTRAQCAGTQPPQETGLTYNSWFGKPHLEMHWWHGIHFALWGRIELLQKSMDWYAKVSGEAYALARRQGYKGLRWQKMTDPQGRESPSSVGAFLIWQQPHFIYFAELCYRDKKNAAILNRYKDLVFATADFMASYATYDSVNKRYILGKGVIPAQERFKAEQTFNPTYELVYWQWALSMAQEWRVRLGLKREPEWDKVLASLSALPVQDDLYLATESATDSYTNPEFKTDHPSVLGALGMLPQNKMVDRQIISNTFDWVWKNWAWKDTWGWDFPMTAMTATRLGRPEQAIDALLMKIKTNTYLRNGHNYQDERLRLYLPGNGGLLAAVAMMCVGYDGSADKPGIPANGWKVKYEGLKKNF